LHNILLTPFLFHFHPFFFIFYNSSPNFDLKRTLGPNPITQPRNNNTYIYPRMTALSSEAHNGAINSYTNGSTQHNSNLSDNQSTEASGARAFANNAFSHLTLYTGNTMRTGTTGQLNTSLKKSNQEVRILFVLRSLSLSLSLVVEDRKTDGWIATGEESGQALENESILDQLSLPSKPAPPSADPPEQIATASTNDSITAISDCQ
jgi:hypothetical protein